MLALLTDRELDAALTALPGWSRKDRSLRATYTFADFAQAFAFMTRVAAAAELQDHHPDWRNVWSRVEVTLSTHDAGGITTRDITLAKSICELATRSG
jgi:4a-hydroxytetrahydrobiopterin dehydratase